MARSHPFRVELDGSIRLCRVSQIHRHCLLSFNLNAWSQTMHSFEFMDRPVTFLMYNKAYFIATEYVKMKLAYTSLASLRFRIHYLASVCNDLCWSIFVCACFLLLQDNFFNYEELQVLNRKKEELNTESCGRRKMITRMKSYLYLESSFKTHTRLCS